MIGPYSIILLPIDGSPHSFEAADHALSLANAFQSKRLIALHVSGIKRFVNKLAISD
jgi:nucleotide-binding universal stress UspA family protein